MPAVYLLCLCTLLIGSCEGEPEIVTGVDIAANVHTTVESAEKLDAVYQDNELLLRVVSNGCTRAEHFSVSYTVAEDHCTVVIERNTPDYCKRASAVENLTINWPMVDVCQGKMLAFANPPLVSD